MEKKKKITIPNLFKMKKEGKKFSMTTAYDYALAFQVDKTDIEMILVGDSAAMVMFGHQTTLPITMDTLVTLAAAVVKGAPNTFVIGDMPFLSYEVSKEKAIENAGRFMKEAGVDAIKLEGGERMACRVSDITKAGIPVMGHIGLTPQSSSQLGGFTVQGKELLTARKLINDALALEEAGAFSIVLEAIPTSLSKIITEKIKIPTIGIGAGLYCDAQVLVIHDLLGLFEKFTPKFVKRYAQLGKEIVKALSQFDSEVKGGKFPDKEYSYNVKDEKLKNLIRKVNNSK